MFFGNRKSSIRLRLTALFVVIFGVTLIVFCSVLYSAFTRSHQRDFDIALFNHAVDVSRGITFDLLGNLAVDPDLVSSNGKIFPFSVGRTYIQILDANGKVFIRSNNLDRGSLPFTEQSLKELSRQGVVFQTIDGSQVPSTHLQEHGPYRLLSYLVRNSFNRGLVLQIAVPMQIIEQSSRGLFTLMILGIPLTLILAGFGGLYLSRRALAPVAEIIKRTQSISASRLSDRIPVPLVEDEMRQLTVTLNDLLDRLQRAFENQERFIDDASHELKTPLAILRGELEVLRNRPRDAQEINEFFKSASQELNYLSKIVEDLLLLARMDAGAATLVVQKVRLDEVVMETVSRLEVLAREKKIKIKIDLVGESFEISGDEHLLKSVVKNLMENAVKFSPENTTIEVRVADSNERVAVSVVDQGPGIPHELSGKIFDRFYRVNPNDSKATGAGLGLAIARRIVEAHTGKIEVVSERGRGSTFIAEFPKIARN